MRKYKLLRLARWRCPLERRPDVRSQSNDKVAEQPEFSLWLTVVSVEANTSRMSWSVARGEAEEVGKDKRAEWRCRWMG